MIQMNGAPVDSVETIKQAFGGFPSGVTVVGGTREGVPIGMAASSFTSVSIDPPLVSVCVQNTSTTWPTLRELPRVGLSVLAEGQEDICLSLASKYGDRFADVDWSEQGGAVFVHGATVWLDCRVEREVAAGDHTIVLLRIDSLAIDGDTAPLIFHRSTFRQLVPLS